MKADAYTGFLSDKVKVYGTEKKSEPFELPKRLIRRAYPFLLASAMVITGCGSRQEKTKENEACAGDIYTEAYHEVVDKYRLTALRDKEPLSQAEVNALIMDTKAPALKDTNFNHCPENTANFWEIVKNGIEATKEVQFSTKLNNRQKKEYQITAFKMLSQISRAKGTKDEIDLNDYNNLKTFLYFEKVLKYGDSYDDVLAKSDGWVDERSEAFGRYYKDYLALESKAGKMPGVDKFAKALYSSKDRFILSYADSAQANGISKKMLGEWLEKQGVKDKKLWYYANVEDDDFCNSAAFYYNRGSTVGISIGIDPRGNLDDGDFSPVGTIIIHELQHLMQKKPASAEDAADNKENDAKCLSQKNRTRGWKDFSELGPTLYSLAFEDGIYKKIHGIKADEIVEYGMLETPNGKVEIGEVAVWFKKMMQKYPHKSVDKVVSEDEVLHQLQLWGDGRAMNAAFRRRSRGE